MEEEIQIEVKKFLQEQENTGTHAGGSGHLSNINLVILSNEIKLSKTSQTYSYAVTVRFVRTTETEFTYYPDNPPIEEEFIQTIYLDDQFIVTGFTEKKLVRSNVDLDLVLDGAKKETDQKDTRSIDQDSSG